jgi:hypothetical protein
VALKENMGGLAKNREYDEIFCQFDNSKQTRSLDYSEFNSLVDALGSGNWSNGDRGESFGSLDPQHDQEIFLEMFMLKMFPEDYNRSILRNFAKYKPLFSKFSPYISRTKNFTIMSWIEPSLVSDKKYIRSSDLMGLMESWPNFSQGSPN